jgi:hypothetical protein
MNVGIIVATLLVVSCVVTARPLTHDAFVEEVGGGYGPEIVQNWAGYMHGTWYLIHPYRSFVRSYTQWCSHLFVSML